MEKILEFLKKNRNLIILVCVFFVVNLLFLVLHFNQTGFSLQSKHFYFALIVFLLLSVSLSVVIFYAERKKWRIERVFIIIGSILGLFYLILIPIGRVPDETSHFYRAYAISEGQIIAPLNSDGEKGSYLPNNIQNVVNTESEIKKDKAYSNSLGVLDQSISSEQVFISRSTDGCNPINYIPQSIGILLGRILHLPLLLTAYLGRLFNLAFYIIVIYFCLKFIPVVQKSLFLIACLPIMFQTAASLSGDCTIICGAIALISFVLYTIFSDKENLFKIKDYLLILLLCAMISLTKPVYAFICLLLFWIPKEKFGNKKRKICIISGIGLITFIMLVIWYMFFAGSIQTGNGGNTGEQINFIIHNPIKFILVMFNDIANNPVNYLNMMLGGSLELLDVVLSPIYIIAVFAFFILLCVENSWSQKVTKTLKSFAIIAPIAMTALIIMTFYVQWSKVGVMQVEGVQGRYFLPYLILVPIACLPVGKIAHKGDIIKSCSLYAFMIFLNIYALSAVFCIHM